MFLIIFLIVVFQSAEEYFVPDSATGHQKHVGKLLYLTIACGPYVHQKPGLKSHAYSTVSLFQSLHQKSSHSYKHISAPDSDADWEYVRLLNFSQRSRPPSPPTCQYFVSITFLPTPRSNHGNSSSGSLINYLMCSTSLSIDILFLNERVANPFSSCSRP